MSVPTFLPDAAWMLRLPLLAPFGVFAYEGSLPPAELGSSGEFPGPPLSFDPEEVGAVRAFLHWYHYSDYAQFPWVEHCSSVPDFLRRLVHADLTGTAQQMHGHYKLLERG